MAGQDFVRAVIRVQPALRSHAVVAMRRDRSQPTHQSSNFLPHGEEIEQVRDRKGQEASPQDGRHHVQASTRRDRNRSKRCLRSGGYASLPGEDQEARISNAQVSCDREREPGLGCEPKAGEHEDRKRKPEELKPIDRDERAQHCVASLKDAENPEIDEPEKFRAGSILKGTRSQFSAKRGDKKRERSQELQFKKTVHETSHTSRTLTCLKGSPPQGAPSRLHF